MKFIDFHTHNPNSNREVLAIQNFIVPDNLEKLTGFLESDFPEYFSIGIHPWFISTVHSQRQISTLTKILESKKPILLGECGLDKLRGDYTLQKETLLLQLNLAETFNIPVILHVVKSFNEIIALKRVLKPKIPWIIHGYDANLEIAQSLADNEFYLSFGSAILKKDSKAEDSFRFYPKELIFLETDDQQKYRIEAIYQAASMIKELKLVDLQIQIANNFKLLNE